MKPKTKTIIYLILLFLVGVGFRLWIAKLVPQPFINDQKDYDWFATKILRDPHMIASHSFRTYPMGLLAAFVYKVFGFGNHTAIFVVQAIMDSSVIVMVYFTLRRGANLTRAAWIGAVTYALNPFTSGYVNVVLAEILTIWAIGAIVCLGVLFLRRPAILWGVLFGLVLGLAAESRNAAFLWAAIPLGLIMLARPVVRFKKAYAGVVVGLILTVIYPLYANWRDFGELNITTVDSFYAKEFFNGAIIKRLPPLAPPLPKETYEMYAEYYTEYWPERQNSAYRQAVARKYYQKAWDVIARDPWDYIRTRFDKMWYVWQKEAIYVYVEPGYESHRIYTYTGNLILLVFSLMGLLFFPVRKGSYGAAGWWIRWTIAGSIAYGTLVFCFTHAEGRLTIPFYPLLFISAAIGISQMSRFMKRLFFGERVTDEK